MSESRDDSRVALYIDFDNVVISRYDEIHGRDAWRSDNARDHVASGEGAVAEKLATATVDVGAIVDYASSFGVVAITKAYADWSVAANAAYKRQLVDRSVELTQMFPVSGTKNGADIQLSIDAVADITQHPDITHVVIAAGDSDFIPLARRCKRQGRHVIGIGVSGSTSRALVNACDEFRKYDALPGVSRVEVVRPDEAQPAKPAEAPAKKVAAKKATAKKAPSRRTSSVKQAPDFSDEEQDAVTLLRRAVNLALERSDAEWLHGGGVKSQMQRMDPGFKEKQFGYKTFTDFVQAHPEVVETRTDDSGHLRLRRAGS